MRKISILLLLLMMHSTIFSQKEYSIDDIRTVLSEFLISKDEQSTYSKEELKQYIFFEEIIYKDQSTKRDFGVYVFYLTTVDPLRKYMLIKNGSNYIIIDFRVEYFLDYIYNKEDLSIDNELLISYIKGIQNMNSSKSRVYSIENVSQDARFIYLKEVALNEY